MEPPDALARRSMLRGLGLPDFAQQECPVPSSEKKMLCYFANAFTAEASSSFMSKTV